MPAQSCETYCISFSAEPNCYLAVFPSRKRQLGSGGGAPHPRGREPSRTPGTAMFFSIWRRSFVFFLFFGAVFCDFASVFCESENSCCFILFIFVSVTIILVKRNTQNQCRSCQRASNGFTLVSSGAKSCTGCQRARVRGQNRNQSCKHSMPG